MQRLLRYLAPLLLLFVASAAFAQYTVTNLTSNQTGQANHFDPLLINAWGEDYAPGGAFWVSDDGSGWTTLYDGTGNPQSLKVIVPSANGLGSGSPTGLVYNSSQEFKIDTWTSEFLFVTLDGTIQGWSSFDPSTTLIAVNNSSKGASYTGLAITHHATGNRLYAVDTANNKVDVYDGTFKFLGSFTDPAIPQNFTALAARDFNGNLAVTFADKNGGSGGLIDIYNESGKLLKHFSHDSHLSQPWGIALAPANFGPLSNTVLVANNVDAGTINGYNLQTGKYVGTVTDANGNAIIIDQIWDIKFGGGSLLNGKTNQLFFTAGPNNNLNGLFGVIQAQ